VADASVLLLAELGFVPADDPRLTEYFDFLDHLLTRRVMPLPAAGELEIKAGQMFEPIRVAVCGRKTAPPLFGTLEVLGPELCLERIARAIEKLNQL